MGKRELDGICSNFTKLLVRLEDSVRVLKKILETCQERNSICSYCFRNLSEEDHKINCEFKIMIDEYGSGE